MKFKKLLLGVVTGLALLVGGLMTTQSVSASRHYQTTPVSLRGKWTTPRKNGYSQYLHITKYIFYAAGYQNGYKQSGAFGVSGRKFISGTNIPQLYVSQHRNRYGYWKIGANHSDGMWYLKRVHHNGRIALKSANTYYYHK